MTSTIHPTDTVACPKVHGHLITGQQTLAADMIRKAARKLDDCAKAATYRDDARPDLDVASDSLGLIAEYIAYPTVVNRQTAASAAVRLGQMLDMHVRLHKTDTD